MISIYSYVDNVIWQLGRNYISMGIEARRYQNNYPTGNNDGYLGSLNYSGVFTSTVTVPAVTAGGFCAGPRTVRRSYAGQRQRRAAPMAHGRLCAG
jgi:hypothetical protein